ADNLAVLVSINAQSPDIARGVDETVQHEQGAGDQGMMFGYAINANPEMMPWPILLSHKLARRLAEVRKTRVMPYLRPDGKTQVTCQFDDAGKLVRIASIIVSCQHAPEIGQDAIKADVIKHVIGAVIDPKLIDAQTKIHVNPTGRFVIGGPAGDSGLTGRKIIVDSYGGSAHHGGGAYSGKDPSKVDRSAAYAARWVAKNMVAAGLADEMEVQVSYAIGIPEPTSIGVDTFGTGKLPEAELIAIIRKHFDLRPRHIIDALGLKRPIYRQTAAYGHFGRLDLDLPWERLDMVDVLKPYVR
ncbi:MAG: methionine adenosyltransferase, partial [Bacillota bacterium]|nr:methionine adenosyltransferase [Bacillota bacterium]